MQDRGKSGWVPAAYLQKCSKVDKGDETVDDEDSSNYLGFVVEDGEEKSTVYINTMEPDMLWDQTVILLLYRGFPHQR